MTPTHRRQQRTQHAHTQQAINFTHTCSNTQCSSMQQHTHPPSPSPLPLALSRSHLKCPHSLFCHIVCCFHSPLICSSVQRCLLIVLSFQSSVIILLLVEVLALCSFFFFFSFSSPSPLVIDRKVGTHVLRVVSTSE